MFALSLANHDARLLRNKQATNPRQRQRHLHNNNHAIIKKSTFVKILFFSLLQFPTVSAAVKSQPHNSFVQRRPNSSSCVMCNWLKPSKISMFLKRCSAKKKILKVKSIRLETKQQQTQLIEQVATIVCPHCSEFRTRRDIARHQRCNKSSLACWQLKHNMLIVLRFKTKTIPQFPIPVVERQ